MYYRVFFNYVKYMFISYMYIHIHNDSYLKELQAFLRNNYSSASIC